MVDLSQFELLQPPERSGMALNITESGKINLNPKFMEKINGDSLELRIHQDGTQILIAEKNAGFKLLKSGTIKYSRIVEILEKKGVFLPAHYSVFRSDDLSIWIGTLENNKMAKKYRTLKKGRKELIPKLDELI